MPPAFVHSSRARQMNSPTRRRRFRRIVHCVADNSGSSRAGARTRSPPSRDLFDDTDGLTLPTNHQAALRRNTIGETQNRLPLVPDRSAFRLELPAEMPSRLEPPAPCIHSHLVYAARRSDG